MTDSEFEKIYRLYFNVVFRYVYRLSGNQHIAEEISSDTFFKSMNSIDNFRGDCGIVSWLCQIAKNGYYSYLRKNKLISVDTLPEQEDITIPHIEDQIVSSESAMKIYDLLHLLNEPYKEVFKLRVLSELSFKQIGSIFAKSENWACVTYHRAKKKIQIEMEDYQ